MTPAAPSARWLALVTALAATGCGGGDTATPGATLDHINLSTPALTPLAPGQQLALTATAIADDGSVVAETFQWTSSAITIATVTQAGLVTGVAAGTDTISVSAGGKSAQVVVIVTAGNGSGTHVFADLAAGYDYTICGRATNGTGWCWGRNLAGQIGDGTMFSRLVPTQVSGGLTFAEIETGQNDTCGRTAAGAAYCWGNVIGNGTPNNALVPTAVTGGLTFAHLAVAAGTSCGLTTAGLVYCWGGNVSGTLGNGANFFAPTPLNGGMTFATISSYNNFACGLTAAGVAYCWGAGINGQDGDGVSMDRSTPTAVSGGLTFAHLATGWAHGCAATSAGTTYCWGTGGSGQLGNGATTNSQLTPTPVSGGFAFSQLALGTSHSCGLTASGAAYCWGDNTFGQLGDGTTAMRLVPTPVSGGLAFVKIVASHVNTCGLTAAGVAYCWGENVYGEIGDGTMTDRSVPTAVH